MDTLNELSTTTPNNNTKSLCKDLVERSSMAPTREKEACKNGIQTCDINTSGLTLYLLNKLLSYISYVTCVYCDFDFN